MTDTSNRIEWIDIAKGIGILFVVLGHMETLTSSLWRQFGASFHMPLFFVISGILYSNKDYSSISINSYLFRLCKRIAIPYLLWGLIYSKGINAVNLFWLGYGNNIRFGYAGLWFLPVMFISSFVLFLLLKRNADRRILVVFAIVCFSASFILKIIGKNVDFIDKNGYPLSFDIAMGATGFMCFGCLIGPNMLWVSIKEKHEKIKWVFTIIGLFVITYIFSRLNFPFVEQSLLGRVVMATATYGMYPYYLLGAISGAVAVCFLSKLIKKCGILEFIGENSIIFMVTNHIVISFLIKAYEYFPPVNTITNVWYGRVIILLFSLCIVLLVCSVIAWIIKKFVPNLYGR